MLCTAELDLLLSGSLHALDMARLLRHVGLGVMLALIHAPPRATSQPAALGMGNEADAEAAAEAARARTREQVPFDEVDATATVLLPREGQVINNTRFEVALSVITPDVTVFEAHYKVCVRCLLSWVRRRRARCELRRSPLPLPCTVLESHRSAG